jgi:hypothetical protein
MSKLVDEDEEDFDDVLDDIVIPQGTLLLSAFCSVLFSFRYHECLLSLAFAILFLHLLY